MYQANEPQAQTNRRTRWCNNIFIQLNTRNIKEHDSSSRLFNCYGKLNSYPLTQLIVVFDHITSSSFESNPIKADIEKSFVKLFIDITKASP